MPPLFVASDIHGHRTEMRAALHDAGLISSAGDWAGADARLWLLGDYFDRGPDGIGVIEDIRRLGEQAAAAEGQVSALLGNHEAQIVAAQRFGDTTIPEWGSFHNVWSRWGGQESDLRRLTDEHVAWLTALPAMALVDGHLLMHSDTTRYREFGDRVDDVNAVVAQALASRDAGEWLHFCRLLNSRGAFRADAEAAAGMLATFGGQTVVHGHSTLISQFGYRPEAVREAHRYANGQVLAVDGGVFEGGRILVTRLG